MIDKLSLISEVANFDTAGCSQLFNILPDPDIILNKKAESVRILDDIASRENSFRKIRATSQHQSCSNVLKKKKQKRKK